MSSTAPAFENKANCTKCNTTFNLFTRKHHCRQCGRTYCDRCSSWNIPLPHFGFNEPVRVDEKCYLAIQQKQAQPKAATSASAPATATATASASTAPVASPSESTPVATPGPAPVRTRPCTCNMPLCICPPDEPDSKTASQASPPVKQVEKPVSRPAASKTPVSSSSSSTSTFSGFGGFPSSRSSAHALTYDLQGDLNEQCREAIKQGDHKGVETLVKAGADPNYVDRTGNTLLHLACMFDRWDTVQLFLSRGGNITIKNPAGETPVDLAPPSLAYKIKNYGQ